MTRKHDFLAGTPMTMAERRLGRYLRAPDGHPAGGAPAAEEPGDDAFAAAFDDATKDDGDGAPAPAAADPAAADPAAAPAADPSAPAEGADPAGESPEGESPAGEGSPEGGDPAGGEAPAGTPDPAGAAQADDILNRLAGLINQPAAPAPAAEAPAAPAAAPETPLYTPEELSEIGEYNRNWPDVARAEELKRRGEYHDIIKFMFENVTQLVAPLQEQLRAIGNNIHINELQTRVPDYSETLEQQVTNWIETQPNYLQAAYKQVMQTGTSEEVADLIGRYRGSAGAAPAAPPAEATPVPTPPAPRKTELSSAAIQAAESLAPVSGDRSAVPQGEDPQDFNTAFAKHAATMDV